MKSKPSILFFLLYFFEGAPIGLIWWTIPTVMATQGITVDVLTSLTALATLPWTFKFLIAPIVDRYFITVRSYAFGVCAFQFFMLLGLLFLTRIELTSPLFFAAILFISLFSAIQDVFIDAWAIGAVPDNQRGSINGAMQAGLLTGRWLYGAGLLIALSFFSWKSAILFLCVSLVCSIFFLVKNFRNDFTYIKTLKSSLGLSSFKFIFSKTFLTLALVALLTGFAFEGFGAVVGPFLIANQFEQSHVGLILSATLVTMLLGALCGGKVSDIKGSKFVFLISGLLLSFFISGIGLMHLVVSSFYLISAIIIIYFFIGTFTSASYSFYMTNSRGEMEATRFTFLMAMTNLCESSAAFSVGSIIAKSKYTYSAGFIFTSIVSIIGFMIFSKIFNPKSKIEFTI